MDKLKSLSPQKKGEIIEEKTIELKNEINKDEEEENDEVTY
jgi:predicted transcriptional regulator